MSPHVPEPARGSLVAADGQTADLFNFRHYPVRAVCRTCEEPIEAAAFLSPFEHGRPLAGVSQLADQGNDAPVPAAS